jgi:uncharacterized membrane protein
MKTKDKMIQCAITSLLALTAASTVLMSNSAMAAEKTEKCYGIVKAGLNDCHTAGQSCAGSSVKDNQADAFIFLPKGTCDKIVGASTKPPAAK